MPIVVKGANPEFVHYHLAIYATAWLAICTCVLQSQHWS
jgi:hypothetical protein